ncbi:MAG: hypothetical protein QGM50_06745 [Anaerolineae bacterium]|nr:hypothetical protein [Anaerolineae bacterium]
MSISLVSNAGITQYLLLFGLGPAIIGLGLGAVGAMLFGPFVRKSDSVHVNVNPRQQMEPIQTWSGASL